MNDKIRVLLRIREGYGIGDACQASVVLKHLLRHRPHWLMDFQASRGAHKVGIGLCDRVFYDDGPDPDGPYDSIVDVRLYDNYCNWIDRPNTKVTICLHERFGLGYDEDLGRYHVAVSESARRMAQKYFENLGLSPPFRAVLLHYQGNSNPHKKNLQHWQMEDVCDMIVAAGRVPIVLDWLGANPFVDQKRICSPANWKWGAWFGGDVELLAALIGQAEAFVGIDSGPAHVASSTETPSLVCWTKHHPIQFHDPAPNTTHLVPYPHWQLSPADVPAIADYFESHYLWRPYKGENGLVLEIGRWLAEVLGHPQTVTGVQFVIPNEIEAARWAVAKVRSIAQGRPIHFVVAARRAEGAEVLEFVRQFPFVTSAKVKDVPVYYGPERPQNTRGHYLYVSDGIREHDGQRYHFLIPGTVMQTGKPLDEWMPEFPVDQEVINMEEWHVRAPAGAT